MNQDKANNIQRKKLKMHETGVGQGDYSPCWGTEFIQVFICFFKLQK